MNTHTNRLSLLANSWIWGAVCILLIVLQIAGLLNLSIFGDWMRYGINTLLEILRFYGGLIYLAAGWFFWTVFTLDEFEENFTQGRKLGIGDIGPLPFFFFFALAFWPAVVIYALAKDRKRELKRSQITPADGLQPPLT